MIASSAPAATRDVGGSRELRVLAVASEVFPLIKTGGLADVAGALPAALASEGVRVTTLVPGYPAVMAALGPAAAAGGAAPRSTAMRLDDLFGGAARIIAARTAGLDLLVIDAPHLYDRPGNPYVDAAGRDWPDNAFRFAALGRVAAAIGLGAIDGFVPDVVHAHDWQAGLALAYLHYAAGERDGRLDALARTAAHDAGEPGAARRWPRTVMTVHNLAFQGQFSPDLLAPLGLPATAYAIDGIEYYGTLSYLKAGLQFADRITTVSPTYAAEILTPEAGMGFDGLLRARAAVLTGILNGIDTTVWDPATDAQIAATYDVHRLADRAANTAALQARMNLAPDRETPLFGVISRLTWQKGLDLLLRAMPRLLACGAQLALLGTGDRALERDFATVAAQHRGRVGCLIGYDEALAHLIQAGAHALLVPSRFEPCGLTQLCALRYGAVPVVARVGGLADTIIDANEMALAAGAATGVQFGGGSVELLEAALLRTTSLFHERAAWHSLQTNGMRTDVSWRRPAQHYARLFRGLVGALEA